MNTMKNMLLLALVTIPVSAYEYNPNAKPVKGILKEPGQKSKGPKKSVRFVEGDLHSEQDRQHQQQRRELVEKKKTDEGFRKAHNEGKRRKIQEIDDSLTAIAKDKVKNAKAAAKTPEEKAKLKEEIANFRAENEEINKTMKHQGHITSYNTLKDILERKIDKDPKKIAKNLNSALYFIQNPPNNTPAERSRIVHLFVNYYNEQLKFIPQWDAEKRSVTRAQPSGKLKRLKKRVLPTFERFQETIKTNKKGLDIINQINNAGEIIKLKWSKILVVEGGSNGVRPLTPLTTAGRDYVDYIVKQERLKESG